MPKRAKTRTNFRSHRTKTLSTCNAISHPFLLTLFPYKPSNGSNLFPMQSNIQPGCTCCMSTMETFSPLTSAKPDPVAGNPSETSKTTPSLDDSQDFVYYSQPMTSPRVRVYQDAKLIESSSVDFREPMENAVQQDAVIKQESGREKLQKHWAEVAGRVRIPEKWGQEDFLEDWMDYSLFDSLPAPKGVVSAREALVAERRRENSRYLKMADQNGEKVLSFLK